MVVLKPKFQTSQDALRFFMINKPKPEEKFNQFAFKRLVIYIILIANVILSTVYTIIEDVSLSFKFDALFTMQCSLTVLVVFLEMCLKNKDIFKIIADFENDIKEREFN